jgi:hypothetical protein
VSLQVDDKFSDTGEHGRARGSELLLIDQTYVIALSFAVDRLRPRTPKG